MEDRYYEVMADLAEEERKLWSIAEPTEHWKEVLDISGVISIRRLFNLVKKDEEWN